MDYALLPTPYSLLPTHLPPKKGRRLNGAQDGEGLRPDDEHGGVEQIDGHHLPTQECACGRLPGIGKAPHETAQQHSDRKLGAAVDRESVDEKSTARSVPQYVNPIQ